MWALLSAVHALAAGVLPCAIDFGGLVDAIWVDSGAIFGTYNITIRNTGPRSITRLDNRARYKSMYFAPWPSIVLSPGARVPLPAPFPSLAASCGSFSSHCYWARGQEQAILLLQPSWST